MIRIAVAFSAFLLTLTAARAQTAGCAPPTAVAYTEFNNVRALIENNGTMWQDRAASQAAYEVPAGDGVSSMYAGSLWMGGLDASNQLHLAALTFASDADYYPGPVSTVDGQTTASQCQEFDQIYHVRRQDVLLHRAYFEAIALGTLQEEFPDGYAIPEYFDSWPAHGNVNLDQDFYLAPFFDFDGDGFYNPATGDCPGYDLDGAMDCGTDYAEFLHGDETYFWILNDTGNAHEESQGEPLGVEIHCQAYGWGGASEVLDHTTFYTFNILNRGGESYHDLYVGWWADADVGTATDDYVGCDVSRGLGYAYNGDAVDEASSSSAGYGENPPATGVDFVLGLRQDPDGLDNPETTDVEEALTNDGIVYPGSGWGFGDGIADNERRGMSHFVYYNNSGNPINGEPVVPVHYYNYMQSIWKNGQHMWYGGDGVSAATGAVIDLEANFMFGGDTDPYFYGTGGVPTGPEGWTEVTAGNPPADRRFIMSAGPVTLEAGARNDFTMAALWARDESGSGMSVELLQAASDEVQALFDSCLVDQTTDVATLPEAERLTLTLFPNPSTDHLTLDVPTNTCLERAEVFNLSGQRVHEEAFSEEQGSQSVDVSALPQGAYVMVVHFSDHTRVAKFMVER